MSFFDDDDFDEPTHVADAPRRSGARAGGFGGFGGGGGGRQVPGGIDPQTARQRQLVALGVIIFVLILLVFAVNSCVKSGRTSALKDYSRDVTSVLQESKSDVSDPMFKALSSGADANAVQTELNKVRANADDQAARVKDFSPPGDDDGKAAQHDLELAMNLRAEAVKAIASQIAAAKSDDGDAASKAIAGQLSAFLASDVIVSQRVKPLIDEALKDKDVSGADVQAPRTLVNVTDLDPVSVAAALGGGAASSGGSTSGEVKDRSGETPSTPDVTHGTSLGDVTANGTALEAGNTDPAAIGKAITVNVTNSGGADETNVEVGAVFTPSGGKAVAVKQTIPSITEGESKPVNLTLPASVRAGQSGQLQIKVGGVPGEEKLDNNEATYTVTIGN